MTKSLVKLAIVNTHPIQYHAPLFKLITERKNIDIKVFFTKRQEDVLFDKDFGKEIKWDIPLLDGYQYEFIEDVKRKNIFTKHNLINQIEKWKPDAIWVFGWNFKGHFSIMRYFKGKIPVYFRGDSHLLDESESFSFKKTIRRIVLKWVYKYIDKAFYVGTNNKKYFIKHGLQEEQLVFAPHAIDNARFSFEYSKDDLDTIRSDNNLKEDDLIFGFVGKLEKVKNLEILIRAFNQIKNKHAKLILVGTGHLLQDLQLMAKDNPNIKFVGFQNQKNIPIFYQLFDVFILSSKSETWGLAINEAMAGSCVILASDKVGSAIDLVNVGKNGYVFKYDKKEDIIKKINLIIKKDNVSIQKMKDESKKIISNFDFNNIAKAIEKEMIH